MRVGALFAGYDGIGLALERIWPGQTEVAWYSEIEPAACTVLAAHHPGVQNLGDVTVIDWATVPPVDVLTGGYPCQPFSHAGKRKGKSDERHLWALRLRCHRCATTSPRRPGERPRPPHSGIWRCPRRPFPSGV